MFVSNHGKLPFVAQWEVGRIQGSPLQKYYIGIRRVNISMGGRAW